MRTKNSGFTLVEIAIVLVIIGLLLGGVLKGQELINSAKIKNIANDINGISAAVYAYQDRYRSFPGDDSGAAARWPNPSAAANGSKDGVIAGDFCSGTDTDESRIIWQHLRRAGLVAGAESGTDSFVQPFNAVNGIVGVQTNTGAAAAIELAGVVVCSSNLSGKIAAAIDNQFDDGKPNSGKMFGYKQSGSITIGCAANPTKAAVGATNTEYVDDGATLYTVCKGV